MTMRVAIVDYGSGNLHSAAKAFERAAREADLAADILVTPEPDQVATADRILLPGVGAFGDCRAGLDALSGMVEALSEAVIARGRPFLGICVGMQLMATCGLEHGRHEGFDWIGGEVIPLAPGDPALKIPHMGWNDVLPVRAHPVLADLPASHAFFLNSFHFAPTARENVLAETDYGGRFVAAVGRDNMVGTQFHPEKSQALGLALIRNFLQWRP